MSLLDLKRSQLQREQQQLVRQRQIVASSSGKIVQRRAQLASSKSDSRIKSLSTEIQREEARRAKTEQEIAKTEQKIAKLNKEIAQAEERAVKQAVRDADRTRQTDRDAVRVLERRIVGLERVALDRLHAQVASDPVDREYDCFLSYAKEDGDLANALAQELSGRGLKVWLDQTELQLGLSLQRQLDTAIARSKFGVILVTPSILAGRYWTDRELGALLTTRRRVIPVLDGVDFDELQQWSPMLADTAGLSTENHGLDELAERLTQAASA